MALFGERTIKWATPLLCVLATLGSFGCSDVVTPNDEKDAGTTHPPPPPPPPFSPEHLGSGQVDKIDILLMIDNSRSMADKQQILALAVPDLVRGLVNPRCVDDNGTPSAQQPNGPLDACPAGTTREFAPALDIHVGIITSSLGGHGSDACSASETFSCQGSPNLSNNDAGHLVTRKAVCVGGAVPTYQAKGFLAWDPAQKLLPPGESQLGDLNGAPGIIPTLHDLVVGAGQIGCGYESQLESWYRFLADPEPYDHIEVDDKGRATPIGIDNLLLQQRADFMRSSSALAIVMLTDENDCSIKEYGQFYFAAQQRDPTNPAKVFHLPKARSECAQDPGDPCCKSCGQDPGSCGPDPSCGTLDDKSDDVNLRCFDQKRRFGIDFLYPIDRYTSALTSMTVPNRAGEVVPNPIFSDLSPTDADTSIRGTNQVFLAGIVGVPWQDLARDPKDLTKGFKSASEMLSTDGSGHTTWDYVIGDPAKFVAALDPHMIESSKPRSGTDPITGTQLAPVGAPNGTDPINGHEYSIGLQNGVDDDLQYACVFDLEKPRDCAQPGQVSCDCDDPQNDNPLCEPDPNNGGARTLQARAKGYPGIRELAAIKSAGSQGVVASVCPAQIQDPAKADFGYRPAVSAILDGLRAALGLPCLPRVLDVDASGKTSCTLLEARKAGGACSCDPAQGRAEVSAANATMLAAVKADDTVKIAGYDCFCEIVQLSGSDLAGCQNDPAPVPGANGWCYVDPSQGGNPAIVKLCPAEEKRTIRFEGAGSPTPGSAVFISCGN